jgi:hypothetical protein
MNVISKGNPSIVKILMVIIFITLGLILLYLNQNLIDLFLGAFFLLIGLFLAFYLVKAKKSFNSYSNLTNYDERSEINRLKASDLSFKFLLVTINAIILFNALNPVSIEVFLAFLSSLMAFAIILYFSFYHWNERRIE